MFEGTYLGLVLPDLHDKNIISKLQSMKTRACIKTTNHFRKGKRVYSDQFLLVGACIAARVRGSGKQQYWLCQLNVYERANYH